MTYVKDRVLLAQQCGYWGLLVPIFARYEDLEASEELDTLTGFLKDQARQTSGLFRHEEKSHLDFALQCLQKTVTPLAQTFPVTIPGSEPELIEPELVDKYVVGRVFGASPRTVENWVAQRKIPFLKIGKRTIRFRLADVRRALDRKTIKEIS